MVHFPQIQITKPVWLARHSIDIPGIPRKLWPKLVAGGLVLPAAALLDVHHELCEDSTEAPGCNITAPPNQTVQFWVVLEYIASSQTANNTIDQPTIIYNRHKNRLFCCLSTVNHQKLLRGHILHCQSPSGSQCRSKGCFGHVIQTPGPRCRSAAVGLAPAPAAPLASKPPGA